MITADEARELQNGTMWCKGLWFKARFGWLCGRISKMIENAAEEGYSYIIFHCSDNTASHYFVMITKLYEDKGYYIGYNPDGVMEIRWDKNKQKARTILNNKRWYYKTKFEEEPKNESTSKARGNGKNKGTIVYCGKK